MRSAFTETWEHPRIGRASLSLWVLAICALSNATRCGGALEASSGFTSTRTNYRICGGPTIRALDRLKEDAERLRADMWPPDEKGDEHFAKKAEIYDAEARGELDEERLRERLDALERARFEQWLPPPFPDFNDTDALYIVADQLLGEAKHRELRAILNQLIVDAEAARRQLGKDKGGGRRDWRLEHAILALASVYYDHTRKKPGISRNLEGSPGGPFLRFVKAVFQVFAPGRLKGDEALVTRIKIVRRGQKQKWPGANQGN